MPIGSPQDRPYSGTGQTIDLGESVSRKALGRDSGRDQMSQGKQERGLEGDTWVEESCLHLGLRGFRVVALQTNRF